MSSAPAVEGKKEQHMIGIDQGLMTKLHERGLTDDDIARLFGPRAHLGEIRVRYARGDGDLTSPLPSSRHGYYTSKGWVATELAEEPLIVNPDWPEVPAEIQEHAKHDRVAIWARGGDRLESSARNAAALLAKGYVFAGLADETRRRAVAEARGKGK
jgi:hypothetical protein